MNDFQNQLFYDLKDLVSTSEAFYVTKTINPITNTHFWIFNYRIATFEDFLKPSALECRGIMFEMDPLTASPRRLASMPMHKFFNLNENPSVSNLDLSLLSRIEVKADGSLISTYVDNNDVFLKTKGSLTSSQALEAYAWITNAQRAGLWNTIKLLAFQDFTINMEWTSPKNRIVINYPNEQLTILNVRHNQTGVIYSSTEELQNVCDINVSPLQKHWIESVSVPCNENDRRKFIESIFRMKDIEGFIVKFNNGTWVKIKTDQYRELHRIKDNIFNDKALYTCIVNETIDDLKSLFHNDTVVMERISCFEKHTSHSFNHMVRIVEEFFENNKNADRKSYAIKGQQELPKHLFPLAMELYLGKQVDFKNWMLRFYDIYGNFSKQHTNGFSSER